MLTRLDWLIIAAVIGTTLLLGLWHSRRAGRQSANFFLGGRRMPWWLAGLSMVATTFAADTPLLVTELVRQDGISGNWLWWNFLIGGMLTTFLFARLWRRTGVTTDLEFISMRYGGRPARWLRSLKAVYLGLFVNALVIGWVNLALDTLLAIYLPELSPADRMWIIAGAMALILFYSALSGLLGVVMTDAFQFVLAMGGSIVLAVLVIGSDEVGGLSGLRDALPAGSLRFFPRFQADTPTEAANLALGPATLLAMLGLQWWASWYPGNEPGGGGYIAQRLLSTKNEGHALGATFFFQVFHYALRPWPWILVGLASFILYPGLDSEHYREGYVRAMADFLPAGLQGLLLAAFFAAYMSTISTHFNWGVSYLVNDLYRPFLAPARSDAHYVRAARIATGIVFLAGLLATSLIDTLEGAFHFLVNGSAGIGLVLILRWYWWRVSAWSEIAATLVPLAIYGTLTALEAGLPAGAEPGFWLVYPGRFFLTTGGTVAAILLVTWLVPERDAERLASFYRLARPGGWWPRRLKDASAREQTPPSARLLAWLGGILLVYGLLFAIGGLLLGGAGQWGPALAAAVAGGGLLAGLHRRYDLLR